MAGIDLNTIDLSDPEALAQAFNELSTETPTEQPAPPTTQEAKVEEQPAEKEAATQEKPQQPDEQEPEGVATKDGKHIIPYSVLKSERDRASRAEQALAELSARIQQLEQANQGTKQGDPVRTQPQQTPENELSDEDLGYLKEEFPTVYKALMAGKQQIEQLEAKLSPVEQTVQTQVAEQARTDAETVQDAIDAVPKLAHIQANDPEAFGMAQKFDALLRSNPAWADKPLSERFAKVAEMVEAATGPINLPSSKPEPSQAELRQAAEAKAAQAAKANKSAVPTSLSEFPAGQHAAQDEREAAEQLTPIQLAEKFARMTPEQMDAYFQEL